MQHNEKKPKSTKNKKTELRVEGGHTIQCPLHRLYEYFSVLLTLVRVSILNSYNRCTGFTTELIQPFYRFAKQVRATVGYGYGYGLGYG